MWYVCQYLEFQQKVRDGLLGKTGVFWMSFLDDARKVFMLLYSVKVKNLDIFHKSNSDLFFSFGGHNYARYLTYFEPF